MSTRVMQQNNVVETLVGAAVVAVAVAFLAFAYLRTGSGSLSGYEINAKLAKVDGLAVGTDVRLAGIKIGTVTDLTLDPKTYLVTVHMNIRDDIKLPVDSSVLVTQAGFLGGQYLSVTPGGDDKMMIAGAFFDNAQGSIDVMNLVGRFAGGESTSNQPPKPKAPQGPCPQTPAPQASAPQAACPQAPTQMKRAPDPGAGP
jgi:phospholipid/cholesterol/gamma-HCH transport system substrate-binding protein